MLTKKITSHGNANYVLLPRDFLKMLDLNKGDEVSIKLENNNIIVSPIKDKGAKK